MHVRTHYPEKGFIVSTDQNAREFLDYYLELDGDPEFAVLIEGPWGSGKSHFIDTYFKERLVKLRKEDPDAKDPLIHLTLFGVQDLADITAQMFEKAHPLLGGKAIKFFNYLGSKLGGAVGVNLDPKENAALIENIVLDLSDRILVFDDLERSPLSLVDVMGFINRFVEHDKLKVIVVASEQDIPKSQKSEYRRRKEKLVGKTIKVGSKPGEVLDVFTKRIKQPEVLTAIDNNREKLLATFAASGRPNFRSLRAVLLDFERLVSLVDERLLSNQPALGQLLLYMVALGIEFRDNTIDDVGLRELQQDLQPRMKFRVLTNEQTEEQVRAASFQQRYEHVSFEDPIILPEHLADLFASGSIKTSAINEHIGRHPSVVGEEEVPAWRLMWSWNSLHETEYKKARARFIDELTEYKMVHPGQILHAAGIAIHLKQFGEDLLGGQKSRKFFKDYLTRLEADKVLVPAPQLFGKTGGPYTGLGYHENENTDFASIFAMVAKASENALVRQMQAAAPRLLKKLQNDPFDGSMLHEWGLEEDNFAGFAILNYLDIKDFSDLVLIDGKPNDKLLSALQERHIQCEETTLDLEIVWLKKLRRELMRRVKALSPPYKKFAKMRIEYWFRSLDDRIATFNARQQK